MSFICENCGEQHPPKTKSQRVVLKTRPMTYYNEGKTSIGSEIVQEMVVGPCCTGFVQEVSHG